MAKQDNKKKELKEKLYKLIDSIEDEHTLNVLNERVVPYVIESTAKDVDEIEDSLTEDQLKDLDEAIAEAQRGDIITYEEFKKNMEEWRTKLKSTGDLK